MSGAEERTMDRLIEVLKYQSCTYIGGTNGSDPQQTIKDGKFHGTKRYARTSNVKARVDQLLKGHIKYHGKTPSANKHSKGHVKKSSGYVFMVYKKDY